MPLDRAQQELQQRVAQGNELILEFARVEQLKQTPESILNRARAWHEYNRSWLETYLGRKIMNDYDPPRVVRTASVISPDVPQRPVPAVDWVELTRGRIQRLDSIIERLPIWSSDGQFPDYTPTDALHEITGESQPGVEQRSTIFIVHGHDHAVLHQTARIVERCTDRDAIILMEQANQGQTVIEKFERHAADATYAICLLTADDLGHARAGTPRPRGRQNVILELGYFMGAIGRDRVAVLLDDGLEQPSDMHGLSYISLADGGWKHELGRELEAAGIEFDYGKMP